MLELPILNVQLRACSEDWQQITPTAQGRHCVGYNREVVNVTSSTQVDLLMAHTVSPDGRVCGRLRAEQLAAPPKLRLRLRQFVVALVLVCASGLSAREAVGQFLPRAEPAITGIRTINDVSAAALSLKIAPSASQRQAKLLVSCILEPMPSFPGGQDSLVAYLRRNLHYSASNTAEGTVFIGFVITKTGNLTQAKVLKGVSPALDGEALRVVRKMPRWVQPPRPTPIEVRYTLPITFASTQQAPEKR
ncbi:energy transducer TonB [Hymenobacter sp. J193]|uniref:energy transducer TonB n=1 Tax=Hymenobacter sp. J193 TaxID=2898429 RepID=UPI002150BD3C|nr:energy transducer TonB [Hymenobacter sp. J193]MCR5888398.1 energy transducer TonB [Hymenobacter sp. J193]